MTAVGASGLSRRAVGIAVVLALAAVFCPLAVALARLADPGIAGLKLLGAVAAALLVAPASVGFAVAMRGLPAVARTLAARPDSEHEQIMIRVGMGTAVLGYTLALIAAWPGTGGLGMALVVAGFGQGLAWLFLADILFRPAADERRRGAAMVLDVVSLSSFLHFGGEWAAAWYFVYLWITFGYGFRYSVRHLLACGALSVLGFAVVVGTTPFWRNDLALAGGLMLALFVLPAYVARLIRLLTEAKRAAEAANEAKGRFLAIMSHELRTPLNTVIGMGGLIAKGPLDPDQRDLLGTLRLAARTLLDLISDILDFSKIEAGKFEPMTESFELYEMAQSTVAMLRPEAAAKGLQLSLRIDPALPDSLRGWPQQLRQILLNLTANAVKFTPTGRVAVALDQVSRENGAVRLRLAVRDQGIGIPKEALDKVFELFTQADEAVTRKYGGTGLGLAIVKQLVGLMGGTVAVESEVGKGSTFTVELPFEIDAAAAPRPLDLEHRTIAVIGEADLVASLQAALSQWNGRAIHVATPPADAAAVIVDGRHDALAALSTAHALAERAEAVILVAEPGWSEHMAALAEGRLAAVLPAPVDQRALANALRSLPRHDRRAAPAAEPAPAASQPAPAPVPRRKLKVLVAEDNGANRKIMRRILEMSGHDAVLVNDGEAALEALGRERFDAALLDINMPEMSGYEATKLYRTAHMDEPRLPIIALTADATAETERLCREAGMDAVLTKPVDTEQLLLALDETVGAMAASLGRGAAAPAAPPPAPAPPARASSGGASTVTPISSHPRFPADPSGILDDTAIEALRSLGDGSDFFRDVIETFRADAKAILDEIARAAASGDLRAFREHAHSLRSSAANVGGARLCNALLSLRDVTGRELKAEGSDVMEKLATELARLDAALDQKLREAKRG